eukprot:18248-Heterococcus_DN1.PRE.1
MSRLATACDRASTYKHKLYCKCAHYTTMYTHGCQLLMCVEAIPVRKLAHKYAHRGRGAHAFHTLTVRLLFGGTVGPGVGDSVTGAAVTGAAVTGAAAVGAAVVGCAVVGRAVGVRVSFVGVSVCLSDGTGVGASVMMIVGSSVAIVGAGEGT